MGADDQPENQIENLTYLENILKSYESNSDSVDSSWSPFFKEFEKDQQEILKNESDTKTESIVLLADAFRKHGHLMAKVNPIALNPPQIIDSLKLEKFGFHDKELADFFPTLGLLPEQKAPLKSIIEILQTFYCQNVGFEFKDTHSDVERWIEQEIESGRFQKPLSVDEKHLILDLLTRAEVLENFLHTKHVGKKRFSLEGGETLIPMLNFLIAEAAEQGVEEFCIGMSHRGRLNVLANVLNKPMSTILRDFDEDYKPLSSEGMGDIRYHKGHSNDLVKTCLGKLIKLSMAPNPSHLESVNPVIEGQVHAKQFKQNDEKERRQIIPLLLHGDAALAGQGVVYETLQMGKLVGFETGGTLHLVINNQVGFTTSPAEARSTTYCTDIARTFGAPVFHVNAEDPEICVKIMIFAWEIRQKFHCDVFVDLNCYRKYGHNEGDEPAFTQPLEYQLIRKKNSIRALYKDHLLNAGVLNKTFAEDQEESIKKQLQDAYQFAQNHRLDDNDIPEQKEVNVLHPIETHVNFSMLKQVVEAFSQIPSDFAIHPKIEQLVKERRKMIEDKPFDWGMGEFLAYGTLVWEGVPVRLAGQDCRRGTFSHRHALWVDQITNEDYFPLAHLREGQGRFEVLNTSLSEMAALGFEYGYSTVCTNGLTIWEAQFGDFVNSAQVIIDQYLASGEQKWGQTSGLVLFLPHGFEGQGPEHSSARFERFLALAGHENMQIVNPTTPAQLFHLLRRQVKQRDHKPLIVMTPKGLLRHPDCTSKMKDVTEGKFNPLIDDPRQPKDPKRLILCSGRIYYDLDAERLKLKREDLAIVRFEQLYPLDFDLLRKSLARYQQIHDCRWVQEEPENMGAWSFISKCLPEFLPSKLPITYIGREQSASPATGFYALHKQELSNILHQVFNT